MADCIKAIPLDETRDGGGETGFGGGSSLVERDWGVMRTSLWYHGQLQGSPEDLTD